MLSPEVSPGGPKQSAWGYLSDPKLRTTTLINLAGVMERMDEQILPSLYLFLGEAFNATPSQLGTLTLCRALVQALSSPVGGLLGHYYNRVHVTTWGCLLWGCMTMAFGFTSSLHMGMVFWAINGMGLAMVIPSGQSLIADYYTAATRGKAFGALYLTGAFGGTFGGLYATNIGSIRPMGIEGWRFAFFSVAAVSIVIGVLNYLFAIDPSYGPQGKLSKYEDANMSFAKQLKFVFLIPTFNIIILQGIVGSIPWNALVFFTLYLQLLGMTDFHASLLFALFLAATAIGGYIGGWVGDWAAVRWPNHGRIFVVQFSVAIGIPFSIALMKLLPANGTDSTVVMYAVLMVTFGLLKSWASPACNNPIFAEIVPAHMRNLVYAFDRCFEGAIAACSAPLVGKVAEAYFGFSGAAARSKDVGQDVAKARALGSSLLLFLLVPWTLCLIFYTGLHYTYPKDRKVAAARSALEDSKRYTGDLEDGDDDFVERQGLLMPEPERGDETYPDTKDLELVHWGSVNSASSLVGEGKSAKPALSSSLMQIHKHRR